MKGPEVLLKNNITNLRAWELNARGTGLLCIDLENVLTDYHDSEVRPEAIDTLSELQTGCNGLALALVSNTTDRGYVREVAEQLVPRLGDVPAYYPYGKLRGKLHPDLFISATDDSGVEPRHTALVDDQLKSLKGARKAGLDTFVWTLPYGEHQHLGVRAARPFEAVIRQTVKYTQLAGELRRGDW